MCDFSPYRTLRDKTEILITPEGGRLRGYLAALPAFHELLAFLVWKDLKVQVAQTTLGFGWLVLRPMLNVLVMSLVFGKLARLPSDGHPYLLFLLSAWLPWSYFTGVSSKATSSLLGNSALVTKVYFPRLLLPVSLVLGGLLEFLIVFVLFVLLSLAMTGSMPLAGLLWLPLPLLLLLLTTAGASFWLAALAARFRDVRNAASYLLQLLMFLAPVIWPLSLLAQRFGISADQHWLATAYGLYPLVGVVEGFRRALLGSGEIPWQLLGLGFVSGSLLFISGLVYFQRSEKRLADEL
ncbi:ABC transporter permease [Stagnimonas aquatica]|uniref:Transport permease protein n=1 Tax=Stagnimonas aquatica TaxID=2689987 RepID=A0A3N0VGY3_9GAMM|nr:ABC transporter permease [Stagnimonas aquatica]